MATSRVPPFPEFEVNSDESTVETRWKKWIQRFENFLLALDIKDEARKRAMLLYYAGEAVYDIFDSLPGTGGPSDYATAVSGLTQHFAARKNQAEASESERFGREKQRAGESVDSYHARLRELAAGCRFADADVEIKNAIVMNCASPRLRRLALREKDMSLNDLLDAARFIAGGETTKEPSDSEDASDETEPPETAIEMVCIKQEAPDHEQEEEEEEEEEDEEEEDDYEIQAVVIKEEDDSDDRVERVSQATQTPAQPIAPANQGAHQCPVCRKRFRQSGNLKIHLRIHTGERPYRCSECGRSFKHSANLKKHGQVHTGEKPYRCSECGRSFSQNRTLINHLMIHSGEKPFSCLHCDMAFRHRGDLKVHSHVHSGEKPHSCEECGKRFRHPASVRSHQRVHTGEKPYHCTECGKSFTQVGSLTTHRKLHATEKMYQCGSCGDRFTRLGSLTTHQRIHIAETGATTRETRESTASRE